MSVSKSTDFAPGGFVFHSARPGGALSHSALPRRRFRVFWLVPAFVVLVGGAAFAQTTVYVKVKEAKVRDGTSIGSAVVATPGTGTALTVLSVDGPRYKVRTPDGKEGYVSRLLVSETKPSSGGGLLGGLGHSDVKANESETVASIRGLSPAAANLANTGEVTQQDVKWAEKMETDSNKVTQAQVESFLKAGGVGL